jgi:hypothetical protein
MAGLVAAIHGFLVAILLKPEDVDARHKTGHDENSLESAQPAIP